MQNGRRSVCSKMSETNFDLNNTSINLFDEDSSTCDDESESFDDVNSNINNRQKLVIEWMVKRETHEPHGGIITSDMGSIDSKVTIILGLLTRVPYTDNSQSEGETDLDETHVRKNFTLIVCSKTKVNEWIECLRKKIPKHMLHVCIYYGRNREKSIQSLSQNDIVITTVTLVQRSFRLENDNLLHKIKWHRLILDDTLWVSNYKLQTSKALCRLSSNCHWAFAGSNFSFDDGKMLYSLIRFINYKPFKKWQKWLEVNSTGAIKEKLRHIYYNERIVKRAAW